jgi:hypothetical protein
MKYGTEVSIGVGNVAMAKYGNLKNFTPPPEEVRRVDERNERVLGEGRKDRGGGREGSSPLLVKMFTA